MTVLVTGASGFVGAALIEKLLEKGHKVYALSRHPPEARDNLIPLVGDVTEPNLGLTEVPGDISAVHHLAAIHRLDESKAAEAWETNVMGTANVITFCEKHKIPHLFFCSSSYAFARNNYEKTKMLGETMVEKSSIQRKTIFKPSIIMPTEHYAYFGHFIQFALLVVRVHKRAETVRRYLEGKLRLPVLRPTFRVLGNPDARLNLVRLDDVATAMAEIENEGTFWLTNPTPSKVKELAEWISEIVLVDIRIEPKFQPTPIELAFQKIAAVFSSYTWGDSFRSDLKSAGVTDKKFVQDALVNALLVK